MCDLHPYKAKSRSKDINKSGIIFCILDQKCDHCHSCCHQNDRLQIHSHFFYKFALKKTTIRTKQKVDHHKYHDRNEPTIIRIVPHHGIPCFNISKPQPYCCKITNSNSHQIIKRLGSSASVILLLPYSISSPFIFTLCVNYLYFPKYSIYFLNFNTNLCTFCRTLIFFLILYIISLNFWLLF